MSPASIQCHRGIASGASGRVSRLTIGFASAEALFRAAFLAM